MRFILHPCKEWEQNTMVRAAIYSIYKVTRTAFWGRTQHRGWVQHLSIAHSQSQHNLCLRIWSLPAPNSSQLPCLLLLCQNTMVLCLQEETFRMFFLMPAFTIWTYFRAINNLYDLLLTSCWEKRCRGNDVFCFLTGGRCCLLLYFYIRRFS